MAEDPSLNNNQELRNALYYLWGFVVVQAIFVIYITCFHPNNPNQNQDQNNPNNPNNPTKKGEKTKRKIHIDINIYIIILG